MHRLAEFIRGSYNRGYWKSKLTEKMGFRRGADRKVGGVGRRRFAERERWRWEMGEIELQGNTSHYHVVLSCVFLLKKNGLQRIREAFLIHILCF